jgi:hypothetical protein
VKNKLKKVWGGGGVKLRPNPPTDKSSFSLPAAEMPVTGWRVKL